MNPKVSIIMPTMNRAHLLHRSIDSVLSQSLRDYEFIIIDDGSTDNTKQIVEEYIKRDPRIRYIRYEKNQGIPTVRNRGIAEARGDYVAWQDDDDEWLPGKLEKTVKKLDELPKEYGIVYHAFLRVQPNGKKMLFPPKWVEPKEGDLYKIFLKKNFLNPQAMIFRSEVLKNNGGLDPRYLVLGEYGWYPKLAKRYKFGYVSEVLLHVYYTPGSNSQNNTANANARLMFMKDNWEDLKRYKFIGYHYSVIGDLYVDDKKYWTAILYYMKAFLYELFHVTHLVKASFSLFGINYKLVRNYIRPLLPKKQFKI
ncbi:MAG: glycosyltransferase family 2 protein [Patescibacteria group bacterium]